MAWHRGYQGCISDATYSGFTKSNQKAQNTVLELYLQGKIRKHFDSEMGGAQMPALIAKTREEEILEELKASIDKGIDAMSPAQLREYERKAEKLMKRARRRATAASSTPETSESALQAQSH
jgi:Asp-tRNA(Asn)/Glu-tRNA(Gln) amidotransferase A subunit family amidase